MTQLKRSEVQNDIAQAYKDLHSVVKSILAKAKEDGELTASSIVAITKFLEAAKGIVDEPSLVEQDVGPRGGHAHKELVLPTFDDDEDDGTVEPKRTIGVRKTSPGPISGKVDGWSDEYGATELDPPTGASD